MSGFQLLRRLSAIVVFGLLASAPYAASAQAPTSTQEAIPAQAFTPAETPASPSDAIASIRDFHPTQEDIGDAMMIHQRYQAAIEAYKQADLNSANVWNKMGIAHQMMFNNHDALHCYQESLKIDPTNPRVLNNLGTVYDSMKQYGNAERMYRKAIKLDPKTALPYKNLGTALLAEHKYKKGWEVYKAALEVDPQVFLNRSFPRVENPAPAMDRGAMNYYMAKGCARAGMNDRAIDYLRMALSEGFTSPKKIVADGEFAGLRGVPEFDRLIASQGAQ